MADEFGGIELPDSSAKTDEYGGVALEEVSPPLALDVPRSSEELSARNFYGRKASGFPSEGIRADAPAILPGGGVLTPPKGEIGLPSYTAPEQAGLPEKIAAGAYNVAASVPNFFLTPAGVSTAMAPGAAELVGAAKLVPPAVKGIFSGLAAKSAGEQLGDIVGSSSEGWKNLLKQPQKTTEAALTAGFAPLMAIAPDGGPKEAKPEPIKIVPADIAKQVPGMRYRGSMRGLDQYVFDDPNAKPGEPTGITVSVPTGTGPEGVAAKLAARRAQYEVSPTEQPGETPPEAPTAVKAETAPVVAPTGAAEPAISEAKPEAKKAQVPDTETGLREAVAPEGETEIDRAIAEGKKIAPEVRRFIQEMRALSPTPGGTNRALDVGNKMKSVADLDALAAEAPRIQAAAKRLFSSDKMEDKNKGLAIITGMNQLPREAIEWATNTGSKLSGEGTGPGASMATRPLDWKTHPEVADWLRANGKKLGIQLPDELQSPNPPAAPAAAPTPEPSAPVEPRRLSYGEKYVQKQGVKGAQKRLDYLTSEINSGKRTAREMENLADEANNIRKAIDKSKPAEPTGAAPLINPPDVGLEAAAGIPIPKFVDDAINKAYQYVKDLAKEELNAPKMTDRRKAVLNWSAKLQRSFGEAAAKQRAIMQSVPKAIRREGITNWIQAEGDKTVLRDRANATTDPKLKAGYEAALALTPEEIAIANQVKADYADFAKRGQAADVLGDLKDNYVTQTWNLGRGAGSGTGGTGSGRMLKEKFKFSKASTFQNFFEGEQAGYKPKTKDIAKLLPMYSHEMNSVIAAREMVSEMGSGKASDGRPLLAPKGVGIPVDSADGGKATLVLPKVGQEDIKDYKVLPNQPALSKWKWVSKDDAGNPVFLKADLALHPEAFNHLKNILGRSAIRDWYGTRTTALAEVPKLLVKGIDVANSETKRTMLGLLATFHQIQTGTHAVGHRVNPLFSIPKIDLVNNKLQMDAAQHGLMMLPDRASMDQFMEGFRTSGLISKIPGLGPMADWYSNYLFHDYIPGLKFKTYDAILKRNMGVYDKPLKVGKVTEADVKVLSAEQANAAYGHINYSDLARNPTIQHIAQLGLLAPDFLEARGRFAGQAIKGLTGAKVGREQLVALATLAIAQATGAYVSAKLTDGEWDAKRPFEFVKGNRRYTLRSVPEDMQNLVTKTRQFIHSRLSPLIGKGGVQYLTGVDYRGRKISAANTTKELAAQPLPLSIRGFTGLGNSTLSGMEQLAGALGLRISRYSPMMDMHDMIVDFKKGSDDPKLKADVELQEQEVFASPYEKLRAALHNGDLKAARKEYDKISETRTPVQIDRAMKPWTGGTVNRTTLAVSPRKLKPFTGSAAAEKKFVQQLTPDQKKTYQKALSERTAFYDTFQQMLKQPSTKAVDEYGGIEVD